MSRIVSRKSSHFASFASLPNISAPALVCSSILLSIASFFRFSQLATTMPFVTDQGRALLAGRAILQGNWLWSGPQTSVASLSLGPLYYYLTALALWFSHADPVGPALMTAGGGVLTILLLAWLLHRLQLRWDSVLVGCLIFALSPLTIMQARTALEPSLLPLAVTLWAHLMLTNTTRLFPRLALTLFLTLLAMQLNFSAVLLIPISLSALLYEKAPPLWKQRGLILLAVASIGIGIAKLMLGEPTSLSFFAQQWQNWTPAGEIGMHLFLFFLALHGLTTLQPTKTGRFFAWWLFWAGLGFTLKHVSGDHALALLFPVAATLISLGWNSLDPLEILQRRLPTHAPLFTSLLFVLTFLPLSLFTWHSLQATPAFTRQQGEKVAQAIIALSREYAYALVYRGHLDIYEAADDHLQYLLWLHHHAPVEAGLRTLSPETQERWLEKTNTTPQSTIVVTYPVERASEPFPPAIESVVVENHLLQLVPGRWVGYNTP